MTVDKATPSVTVSVQNLTYGTELSDQRLSGIATATIQGVQTEIPGTFAYKTAAGSVLNAGDLQVVDVTFTPNDTDHFKTVDTTVIVNMAKATAYVNFYPVGLTYGTPLNNSQLDGQATWTVNGVVVVVLGTYTYSGDAGTVLDVGDGQTVAVTFTPTDTANYNPVTGDVTVYVRQA
jgi:hypothetical protein